jgi:hypothetical protein
MEGQKLEEKVSVFILIGDIEAAHSLSLAFRRKGIIPSLFRDMESFLHVLSKESPSFIFVDVDLLAKNERIRTQLPLVFYCKKILSSQQADLIKDYNYLGIVEGSLPLDEQLDLVLNRKKKSLDPPPYPLPDPPHSFSLESLVGRFENGDNLEKFWDILAEFIHEQEEITDFSAIFWEKAQGGIESPQLKSTKYRLLPRIKIGQVMQKGIEFFAQNMAVELALDILGEKFLPLSIRGEHKNPDIIIYLKIKEGQENRTSWKIVSSLLSGIYFKILILNEKNKTNKDDASPSYGLNVNIVHPWEILKDLNLPNQNRYYEIDFRPLIEFLRDHSYTPFQWDAYYKDFINHFALESECSFKLSLFGIHQMVLICAKENEAYLVQRMQKYIESFKWQQYFQSKSIQQVDGILPVLWKLPPNIWDFIKLLEN